MKIKTKLIIAFCIIIFVPILLATATIVGFCNFQAHAIEETYGIKNTDAYSVINSVQLLNRYTVADFQKIQKKIQRNADELVNTTYLQELNEELKQKYSYLIIRRGSQLYYNGGSNNQIVVDSLPDYGSTGSEAGVGTYIDSDDEILVKQVDFKLTTGEEATAFIITSLKGTVPEVRQTIVGGIISIVVILLLTAFMMIIWIYRSMITPIKKLQVAAENIKEGNLDFTIEKTGVDEIGDLCDDFEEMRKRLKESAEEKVAFDKENKELISNISHDLKTPITAVKGYVEGIMDGVADTPEKMDRYIRTIYNKANEMDRLINELTFYSKIDTNRIPYTFNKIHISDYFEDCVDELSVELESSGVSLTYFNYLEEDAVVIADAEQLKRVINNIVSNSLKYMDKPKGVINIRLRDVGDFIQIEIEDNGKGIAQKDLANIFERFYRTDASRNSSKGGSGIGLSIVKKIMEDHGGQVWATSKEGTGTTMYLALRKYQEVPVHE